MKYILAFLFFYTLGTQATNSILNQNDSTAFSIKSAEGISKLLYAFMEDYKTTSENFGEGELNKNEKKGMDLYKSKFLDDYRNFNNSIDLFDSIDSFLANKENGWSVQGYSIFQALRENYESEVSSTNYNLIAIPDIGDKTKIYIKKLNQNKNDNFYWNEVANIFFVNNSNSALEEESGSQLISNETYQINNLSSGYTREIQPESNFIYFFSYLGYIGVFVFGFLCAVIFFNFRIKRLLGSKYNSYKRIFRSENKGFSLFSFDVLKVLKVKKEAYQEKANSKETPASNYASVNDIPEWRRKQIADSQQKSISSEIDADSIQEKTGTTLDLDVNSTQDRFGNSGKENKKNVLYFSAPEQNGTFLLANSSSAATSRSYYKIEYVDDDNIGKLFYRSGNLDMSALSQMDFILSPVCDIENSSLTNPTVINIESDGSVIKEDDSWRILQKIKIKLS